MKSNWNRTLEINLQLLMARLHLETPDFIRPLIGHIIISNILILRNMMKKQNGCILFICHQSWLMVAYKNRKRTLPIKVFQTHFLHLIKTGTKINLHNLRVVCQIIHRYLIQHIKRKEFRTLTGLI